MKKITLGMEMVCRYFICILMLLYGLVKACRAQFGVEEYLKDVPLQQLNGTQLTWAFYDFHPAYQVIIGITEIIIGLLVLFPRTSKLGIVLFLPVSFNIMLLNFMYDIAALPTSVTLFIAGCILTAIRFKSFAVYFFAPVISNPLGKKWKIFTARALAIVTGCTLAFFMIWHNNFLVQNDKSLQGKWEPVNDSSKNYIYFEKGDVFAVRTHEGKLHYGQYSSKNNKLRVKGQAAVVNIEETFYRFQSDSLLILNSGKQEYILKRKR